MTYWTKQDRERLTALEKECDSLAARMHAHNKAVGDVMAKHDVFAETSWDRVDIAALRKALEPFDPTFQADTARAAGWIEWTGGECPVEHGTVVTVLHRSGEEYTCPAGTRYAESWGCQGRTSDIVAYRVGEMNAPAPLPGMKTYLARVVVHFTAEVEADEGKEDQAAAALGGAIEAALNADFLEAVADCHAPAGTSSLSGAVMETLIEGEA